MPSLYKRFTPRVGAVPGLIGGILFVLCGIMALAPRAALAHAYLVSSTPKAQSTVSGPSLDIVLQFDSRVDPTRSTLSLVAPDGKVKQLIIGHQSAPEFLPAKATGVAQGAYVLRWTALSRDGHITRGEIPFNVR